MRVCSGCTVPEVLASTRVNNIREYSIGGFCAPTDWLGWRQPPVYHTSLWQVIIPSKFIVSCSCSILLLLK